MISLIFVALAAMIDAAKDSVLWHGKGNYKPFLSSHENIFPYTYFWQSAPYKWGFFHLCERLRPGMWLMAIYYAPGFPLWKLLLFGALVYIVTHEFFLKSVFRREIK